jgi:hypothetical protein
MAKKRQRHSHRDKYRKPEKYPKGSGLPRTGHSPRPQKELRDHNGKRIRNRGKYPTIRDRIRRRLEVAKEKRAK